MGEGVGSHSIVVLPLYLLCGLFFTRCRWSVLSLQVIFRVNFICCSCFLGVWEELSALSSYPATFFLPPVIVNV